MLCVNLCDPSLRMLLPCCQHLVSQPLPSHLTAFQLWTLVVKGAQTASNPIPPSRIATHVPTQRCVMAAGKYALVLLIVALVACGAAEAGTSRLLLQNTPCVPGSSNPNTW